MFLEMKYAISECHLVFDVSEMWHRSSTLGR